MIDMHCVIFAGGKSSRMGEDKSLLPFGAYNTLTQYQYERMKKIFTHVALSAKSAKKFDFTCKVIEDPKEHFTFAPTAGFVAMFDALHVKKIFVLSVDTPFIDEKVIRSLIEADSEDCDAVITKTVSGSHPMCGIYHQSLHVRFQNMLKDDDHRLGKLLTQVRTAYLFFDDETPFANLNHPSEYQDALKRLQQ